MHLVRMTWIVLNIIFCLKFFILKFLLIYIRMENQTIRMKVLGVKCLKNMQNSQFLKVKNNFLKLEKDVIELNDIELKDREIKIKREIEKLFLEPVIVSIGDMNKFEINKCWK